MKKIFVLRLLILSVYSLSCLHVFSQEEMFKVGGKIFEALHKTQLLECKVKILIAKDSAVIDSTVSTRKYISGDSESYTSEYTLSLPRKEGDYLICVEKKGYDRVLMPLSLHKFYKREYSREIPDIYMYKKQSVDLGEVVVKATKVKFYLRGDTVVFNADAFQLADGSMLDALIRQLPGVELRDNGKIFVNGKFVENLLLNGKNFFKGNHQVLLNNLPNYMVSNVSVYEKKGDDSEFLGHDVAGDTHYSMDVKLKRQYLVGMSGNIEVGVGSDDYYLSRLFAMRFTPHSKMAVYGNANNLSDKNKPGVASNWNPTKSQGGVSNRKMGGMDYNIDDKNNFFKFRGNLQVDYSNNKIDDKSFITDFFPNGNVFNRLVNNSKNKAYSLATEHRIYMEWKKNNLEIIPSFSYQNNNGRSNYLSFSSSGSSIFSHTVPMDSLYGVVLPESYRLYVINRNLKEGKVHSYQWNGSITAKSMIKFNRSPDYLTLYAKVSYMDGEKKKYDHNLVEYYSNGEKVSNIFLNRYFDNKIGTERSVLSKATYTYSVKKDMFLNLSYVFEHTSRKSLQGLYLLNKLDGWGQDTEEALGNLPSYMNYLTTIDLPNSYNSKNVTSSSSLEPFLVWKLTTDKAVWKGQLAMPISFQNRKLYYQRGDIDTIFTKKNTLLNVYSTYVKWSSRNKKYEAQLQYTLDSKAPDMKLLLNIRDTTDPLNISEGNPELKTTLSHQTIGTFTRIYPQSKIMWVTEGVFKIFQNSLSMVYSYNRLTGVKNYKPYNVNGCWNGSVHTGMSCTIRKVISMKSAIGVGYVRSIGLVDEQGKGKLRRSVVNTTLMTEQMQLRYNIGKSTFSIFSQGTWRRSTCWYENFMVNNVLDMKNGMAMLLQLPWKMQLNTDFTLFMRRGYEDNILNITECVWNASLSYPLFKGKFLLKVDGYDLLGQLSNVNRTINARGIVETYTNVLSQYVLLHFVYRFTSKK